MTLHNFMQIQLIHPIKIKKQDLWLFLSFTYLLSNSLISLCVPCRNVSHWCSRCSWAFGERQLGDEVVNILVGVLIGLFRLDRRG